ncbi:ClpP family protease [Phenylobacterium sp.]|nr:ATP-dependent Clp protease proteolytic subunit [Phenylobacterium sp.]MDP1986127.1 ATP-dependent Clp protease proteolytic subunit [Phenylobacterium sp.]
MRERVNRIIARETGQPYDKVVTDTERNFWMNAEKAVEYGLVSKVIENATAV